MGRMLTHPPNPANTQVGSAPVPDRVLREDGASCFGYFDAAVVAVEGHVLVTDRYALELSGPAEERRGSKLRIYGIWSPAGFEPAWFHVLPH